MKNLTSADSLIADGYFDEAIDLLEPCSEVANLATQEKTNTFKLLADAYLAKRYIEEARAIISRILDIAPNFAPDINLDSQQFKNLVAELKQARAPLNAPQGFTAVLENDVVRLSWAPINNAPQAWIQVLRGNSAETLSQLDSLNIAATGYTDPSPLPGNDYFYAIQWSNAFNQTSNPTEAIRISIPSEAVETVTPIADNPPKKKSNRKVLLFGGGGLLVAGGIVVALLGSSGGGPTDDPMPTDDLPSPPTLP